MLLHIPNHNIDKFRKRVKEIATRSNKLGLGEVSITSLGQEHVVYYPVIDGVVSKKPRAIPGEKFELTGPNIDQPLSLGGYEFVGKIDHTHSEYMWKAYGGAELPSHIHKEVSIPMRLTVSIVIPAVVVITRSY
ncbi:hypothetical protein NVP1244A_074 [Vibrio phage 1.244.A._10N.261.54.C3]|nr:hypothetical protein NVP1244A_074 [Vibrio phage 1.244.A._10N.261.54.C3]AUR98702.1 hypothetical protein NVP1255O_074 [Vibrio phage 1.255.O._10N.286.45.F1]